MSGLKFTPLKEFLSEPQDVHPSIWGDGIIPSGGVVLLVGPSATGKTTFAVNLTIDIACGNAFLGIPSQSVRVLYLAAEGHRHFFRELVRTVCLDRKLDPAKTIWMTDRINLLPMLTDLGLFREVLTESQAKLVVLDTYGYFVDLQDENANSEVTRKIFRPIQQLARELDVTFILCHHTTKKGDAVRGAYDFEAKADSVLWLVQKGGKLSGKPQAGLGAPTHELRFDKLRCNVPRKPLTLVFNSATRTFTTDSYASKQSSFSDAPGVAGVPQNHDGAMSMSPPGKPRGKESRLRRDVLAIHLASQKSYSKKEIVAVIKGPLQKGDRNSYLLFDKAVESGALVSLGSDRYKLSDETNSESETP